MRTVSGYFFYKSSVIACAERTGAVASVKCWLSLPGQPLWHRRQFFFALHSCNNTVAHSLASMPRFGDFFCHVFCFSDKLSSIVKDILATADRQYHLRFDKLEREMLDNMETVANLRKLLHKKDMDIAMVRCLVCMVIIVFSLDTAGHLSFGPTAQCAVHALKGLACRKRVTPASSPASHCKQCSALTSPSLQARGCASPSRAR